MDAMFVYITVASEDEASRLARTLVEERLVACANLGGGMRSIYRWQGRIEEAEEIIVIAKTREDLLDSVTERVRALHAYECPCVVGLPVVGGNPDYLAWLASETQGSSG